MHTFKRLRCSSVARLNKSGTSTHRTCHSRITALTMSALTGSTCSRSLIGGCVHSTAYPVSNEGRHRECPRPRDSASTCKLLEHSTTDRCGDHTPADATHALCFRYHLHCYSGLYPSGLLTDCLITPNSSRDRRHVWRVEHAHITQRSGCSGAHCKTCHNVQHPTWDEA